MAKKKVEKTVMPAIAEEVKTKPVRLDLSPELHRMLRVVAAEQGKPMAVFARDVVERTVREMHSKRAKG
jgi:predicted DNA-binding protein